MKLTLARVAEFTSAVGEFPREDVAQAYSIDSRTIGPGQLFFAVKGERLDGHDFVDAALEKGAVAAVVQKNELDRYSRKSCLLAVDDTLLEIAERDVAPHVAREVEKDGIGAHERVTVLGNPIMRLDLRGVGIR